MEKVRTQCALRISLVLCIACSGAFAQTLRSRPDPLPFGTDGYVIPPSTRVPATPARVVQLLSEALSANPATSRRVELLRDLGDCQSPAALTVVVKGMSDPEPAVRAQAAWAVGMIGDSAALNSLQMLQKDPNADVRIQAMRAASKLGDASSVTAGLTDSDETCFAAACELASSVDHQAVISQRLPELSVAGKRLAVRALGRNAAVTYVPLLVAQLSSGDVPLTIETIDALAQLKATAEVASVKALLGHHHPSVRRAAVRAMSVLANGEEQIAVARQMLLDPDLTVREASCVLLSTHPSPDTLPKLMEQLSAGYGPLRIAARDALVASHSVAHEQVVEAAVRLLGDADRDRRVDGSFILGQTKSDAALDQHRQLLKDTDWFVVEQAVASLGDIGRVEVAEEIGAIAARATDPSTARGVHETEAIGAAFIACGKLAYQPALAMAKKVIPEKLTCSAIIRSPAIWAAGVLADPADADVARTLLSVANDNSPYEVEEARFEAIKAVANLNHVAALDELRKQSREQPVPSLRWMAHIAADRLEGRSTPSEYTPPVENVIAETVIRELGS